MALQKVAAPNALDYAKLSLLGAIWGIAFHFINIAVHYFNPVQLAFVRVLLGAVTILMIIIIGNRRRYWPNRRQWGLIILSSFLSSTLPYYFINWGQQSISGSEASLLIGFGPFLSLLLSHYITEDERLNRWRVLAVIIGFIGLVFIFWPEISLNMSANREALLGKLAVVIAACCYAVGAIVGRFIAQLPTMMTSFYLMAISVLVLAPKALNSQWPMMDELPKNVVIAVFLLGTVATGLAINIRLSILRKNGAIFMSQVVYLIPIFGVLWGVVFFDDKLSWSLLAALMCVILGLIIMKKAGTQ